MKFQSYNPATEQIIWEGCAAGDIEISDAIDAAKRAYASWSQTSDETRLSYLTAFAEMLKQRESEMAECISMETGKPLWESRTEVSAMIQKVVLSQKAYLERTGTQQQITDGITMQLRHRSLGVLVVLGPYNFPGHLPNGHIIPALLAGNTVIFKPSELTPWVAEKTLEIWAAVGLPSGVLNGLQGGSNTAKKIVGNPMINGVLFTGSYQTGRLIHQQMAGNPDKMLALEMGGNNPLIVTQVKDIQAAAYQIIQSAFISAGQRCTCARRLILIDGAEADLLLTTLIEMTKTIKVGAYTESPEPFMGPVISATVAANMMAVQARLCAQGAIARLRMQQRESTAFLTPGILDVTAVVPRVDEEFFGPLLQVIRCPDFQSAIQVANETQYGLAAGILTDNSELFEIFYQTSRAGIINWNRPLTGASSQLPFGGVGHSGNYRPSAYYAADYCAYPVASLLQSTVTMPVQRTPGVTVE